MLANFLFIICLITLLVLFVVVYVSNTKKNVNRLLSLFLLSTFIWLLTNFLTNISTSDANILLFSKLSLIGAILAPLSFLLFVFAFVHNDKIKAKKVFYLSIMPFLILITTPFSLNVESASIETFEPGVVYPFLMVILIAYFVAGLYMLNSFRKNATSQQKAQISYFFTGFVLSAIPATLANGVLPLFGISEAAQYGSISAIFVSVFIAIAIVRHSLLDIRLIVFRSIGYIFSVGLLVILFAVLSSIFSKNVFDSNPDSALAIILNAVFLTIAILAYPPLKTYFDKITSKYFFRDAYDPQEFLDTLNKNIVSNIELGILLRHTTSIIQENLKSSFCQIAIHETENVAIRIVGTEDIKYSTSELSVLHKEVKAMGKRTLLIDDIPEESKELRSFYSKHHIDLIVHLTTSSYGADQTIAYIIFGAKKSGNIYSGADLKIIDIIADELVIAIQNALRFEEIQEFNVTLQKKVNDATGKLRKTNEKLKAMDETKDEFISMASHQLRTPLTSVKGYLSMVLEGDAGEINDNQKKLLDQAFVSSQRMVYLIADLLNVSRLRTGKFIIDARPTNLADVVEGEISQLVEQAKAKNQDFTYDKPQDFPILMLDETKIRQVIMNFADNALYYTPSGGKIKIELTTDKNHIYFAIKDNGIGVPKDEQKHMFTKFYRAKNARNARPDGTGLGLFMAKKVITAQGGNILFESSEGKGSTFGFSFNKKHLIPSDDLPDSVHSETQG